MKQPARLLIPVVFLGLLMFSFGPRPDTSWKITFDGSTIGSDLDAYLRQGEAGVPALRENAEKLIVWNDPESRSRTDYALVYIHGFSASRVEIDPVPRMVAEALGANLFYTRLTGHGRDGAAMAEATLDAWANDMAEAVAIGERLGNKVILLSASTGGTLSVLALSEPSLAPKIAGMASVSPNFAVKGASTGLLNMPWAETILPLVFGDERSFEPENDAHAKGWTTRYPSSSVFPMAALLRVVQEIDYSKIETPALFIFSPEDKVVVAAESEAVARKWGGPIEVIKVEGTGDSNNHVIEGDALSPQNNEPVANRIIEWAKKL
jgi:pimeloyl-ACP methyl ester carboxylesterase